jgi:protein-disulfide isomerase
MAKTAPETTKSTAVKKTPAENTPAETRRNRVFIPLLLGGVLVGAVLGMIFSGGFSPVNNGSFNARVEAYIQENPDVVINALNAYVQRQDASAKQQAINLVSANDGKTVMGNPDGDVTIYEFSDYNCGYCKRVFSDVKAAIEEDGNIRLVIKEFPILAESSLVAARLSMAAAELGLFEEFHTALMTWQGALNEKAFSQIATDVGVDLNALAEIVAKGDIDDTIEENLALARQIQITGTPGFVIGNRIAPGYIPKDQILELVRDARNQS